MAAAATVEAGATLAGGVERGAGSRIAIVEEVDEHSPRVVHCSPVGECESKEADEPTHTTACPDGAASAASAGLAGAAGEEGGGDAFAFTHVASWQPSCLKDKDTRALLAKWGMGDSLVAAKFSFSRRLRLPQREGRAEARKAQLGAFLRDALNDATVKRAVPLGGTSSTGATLAAGVTEVVFSELAVTKTSMSFFDRLEAEGIVHGPMWATGTTGDDHEEDAGAGGTIKKQFDVVVDGVTCQDELRDALANPDTEHVGLFDEEEEEAELLFRVFRQFVIGGSMCQWEDNVRPYLAVTQSTYRDLVSVAKHPHTGQLVVKSTAVELQAVRHGTRRSTVLPSDSPFGNCWAVVDEERRTLTLWYCPFVSFW